MIVCPVCRHSNDDFSIKCTSCGSFIQDRVPNLDLFSQIWLMIESPEDGFRRVIIAEHKNFVLFLSTFLGIAAAFTLFWAKNSGNSFDNLFPLLLLGIVMGLIIGIPVFFGLTGIAFGFSSALKGRGSFKETYGVVGWSLVPIVLSVVFVLPLELGTLGLVLFSSNPSAFEMKPVVTMVLLGLDGAAVVWSMLLAAKGISMVHRFRFITALMIAVLSAAGVSYISFLLYSLFNI
ncbi:MAG: Yip1 family protein [Bacteroidota bacterium]